MKALQTAIASTDAASIAERFVLRRAIQDIQPYGDGLINDTFLLSTDGSRYILQRINKSVFPQPERIMSNLAVLAQHLAERTHPELRIPTFVPARDGLPFVRDGDGGTWRLMDYIPNTQALTCIDSLEQAREVGRVLARFHVLVSDLPPSRLTVTLPGFHVTPAYLERFARVVTEQSGAHSESVLGAIGFVATRRRRAAIVEQARRERRIPERVIHGDPKLDNILFDRDSGRALSLIDLDTVQPGLVHYDIGDCMRSCCNRSGESANSRATFDLDVCRAILRAYASETSGLLGAAEIELLFDAIRLIPFELGVRFLTDHLEGDRYFRVTARGQNLRKARVQLALVEDIESKEREIRGIVTECFELGQTAPECQPPHRYPTPAGNRCR